MADQQPAQPIQPVLPAAPAASGAPAGADQVGVAEVFARYAEHVMARYADGANGRVRGGHVVHAVRAEQWIGQLQVPAPACHVGIGSWDLGVLEPTGGPVTCARCAHLTGQTGPLPAQLALW